MRPAVGEVLHFSEDPTIELFRPRLAKPDHTTAYVWAVAHDRAPDYWFPRQCPRAMAWVGPSTTSEDRDRIIGADSGTRVHAVEYAWLDAIRSVELYAYRLPAHPFTQHDAAMVTTTVVRPLARPNVSTTCSPCMTRLVSSCGCCHGCTTSGPRRSPARLSGAGFGCGTLGRESALPDLGGGEEG